MENTQNNLLENIKSPLKLIVEAKKYGIKGFKRFFLILILFGFSNLVILGLGIGKIFTHDLDKTMVLYILLVFVIGVIFTAVSAYKAYQFLFMNALFFLYKSSSELFKKICETIIEKVDVFMKTQNIENKKMDKVLKINEILSQNFTKIPGFFQRRIINWLNKLPLYDMIFSLKDDIVNNKKEEAALKLQENMNLFITENIFNKLNTRWVLPVFILNIAIQVFIITTKL